MLRLLTSLALVVLCTSASVHHDTEQDDPIGYKVGSHITEPGAMTDAPHDKLRSVLLSYANADMETSKDGRDGNMDYWDNPASERNLAARGEPVSDLEDLDVAKRATYWTTNPLYSYYVFYESGDWCKLKKTSLGYYLYGADGKYRLYRSVSQAKAECLKAGDECTGVTKYSSRDYRLMKMDPEWMFTSEFKKKIWNQYSKTSYTKCPGIKSFKPTFDAKIKSLTSNLETKLESVNTVEEMTAFTENEENMLQILQLNLLKKVWASNNRLWHYVLDFTEPTVAWIFNDLAAMRELTLSSAPIYNQWQQAVLNLAKLIKADPEAKSGMKLKLAAGTALTFAYPVKDYANTSQIIDMVQRYKSYLKWNDEGVLLDDFKTLNTWQYRYVVGAWRTDSELEWARANALEGFRNNLKIGDVTHSMISYNLHNKYGVSVQDFDKYYAEQTAEGEFVYRYVSMAVVQEVGAVCGGISKFGVDMAQAFGLPAFPVSQPAHCAFFWYRNGAFKLSNDVCGLGVTTAHSYVGFPWVPKGAYYLLMDAAQKNPKFWQSELMRLATELKSDVGTKFTILEHLTNMAPQNYDVWMDLVKTLAGEHLVVDAAASLLHTVEDVRENVASVGNLAPECPVTTSASEDPSNNLVDLASSSWTSTETSAWFEVDLQGTCNISSLEIRWWGISISKDYDIFIKGPNNPSWTKVLDEGDIEGKAPGANGWSNFPQGWSHATTHMKVVMREGRLDPWAKTKYFGIRRVVINGVRADADTILAYLGSDKEVALDDICAVKTLSVLGTGTVTVSGSTDGENWSTLAVQKVDVEKAGYGWEAIPLSGVVTHIKYSVERGGVSGVYLGGVRYTVKDVLRIQLKKDLGDIEPVEQDIMAKIVAAGTESE